MKVGDSVVLKSGSQAMTIDSVRKDGRVVCVYFDHDDKMRRHVFAAKALQPYPKP
jgi:uncharacterized protein YodC (DUF2158 family)